MKIYTVTGDFFSQITRLFPQHSVEILPNDYSKIQADLLVFTGGEDIDPKRYGYNNERRGWFNQERDELELSVFKDVLTGKFDPTKVLGICRGLQLINVGLRGTLVQDIHTTFNTSHSLVHPVEWLRETPLTEIFPVVNSMHHQGIEMIGEKLPYTVLAIEKTTQIIEAIQWMDKYFAVQFHPEMMNATIGGKFSEFITDWVSGRYSFAGNSSRRLTEKHQRLSAQYVSIDTDWLNI